MTLKQATAYANWLTEIFAMKEKVKAEGVKIAFSIPTKKQWIRAARAESTFVYPWGGPFIRNSKGAYLSNFKNYDAADIHYNRDTKQYEVISQRESQEGSTITAPAESYYPNQFGIYNMSGNVAELLSDDTVAMGGSWYDTGYDVRVESQQSAT